MINKGMHQNTVFKIYKISDKLPRMVPGIVLNIKFSFALPDQAIKFHLPISTDFRSHLMNIRPLPIDPLLDFSACKGSKKECWSKVIGSELTPGKRKGIPPLWEGMPSFAWK
jgi:hypothetical protein